jgi:hypothetical protein
MRSAIPMPPYRFIYLMYAVQRTGIKGKLIGALSVYKTDGIAGL